MRKFKSKKTFKRLLLIVSALLWILAAGCGGGGSSTTAGTGRYFLLARYTPEGIPDIQFNEDGIVYTFFPYKSESNSDFSGIEGPLSAEVHALAFDKQKRIVAVGWAVVDQKKQIAAARYLGDHGELDQQFANAGKFLLNVPKVKFCEGRAVTLDNEGRILIAGFSQRNSGPNYCDFVLARLNEYGKHDTKFGKSGVIVADFPEARNESPCLISVRTSGAIIAAGYDDLDMNRSLLIVAKFNSTGTPDGTFGTNGLEAAEAPTDLRFTISDVAIDAAGNLVAAGWFNMIGEKQFALARYNQYGKLDTDFGTGGVVITDIPETNSEKAAAVTIDSRGRIIAAGETGEEDGNRRIVLARYNMKGIPDSQFHGDGIVIKDISESIDEMVNAVAVDAKGRIVVVGQAKTEDSQKHILLVRYTEDGRIDSTFSAAGSVMADIPGSISSGANAIAIDADERIVIGGWVVID